MRGQRLPLRSFLLACSLRLEIRPLASLRTDGHTGRQQILAPCALPWLDAKVLCSLRCVSRGSFQRVEMLELNNMLLRETNLSQDFCGQ